MPDERNAAWGWVVFALTIALYIPLLVGGRVHPEEINVASFGIWQVISLLFLYTTRGQKQSHWLALGYFFGNIAMLSLAFSQGGYTFNLGEKEMLGLFSVVGAIVVWTFHGFHTGTRSHRVLYLGVVVADLLSFYPQVKQFWGPESASLLTLSGWAIAIIGPAVSLIWVEEFFQKLRKKENLRETILTSLFSLEQFFAISAMTIVMAW